MKEVDQQNQTNQQTVQFALFLSGIYSMGIWNIFLEKQSIQRNLWNSVRYLKRHLFG
jgi:hypothetical protein